MWCVAYMMIGSKFILLHMYIWVSKALPSSDVGLILRLNLIDDTIDTHDTGEVMILLSLSSEIVSSLLLTL